MPASYNASLKNLKTPITTLIKNISKDVLNEIYANDEKDKDKEATSFIEKDISHNTKLIEIFILDLLKFINTNLNLFSH